ncbi:IS30 family transposase [Microbacterium limosum]
MSRKIPWATRAGAVRGLIAGRSAIEFAPTLGVSMSVVKLWAKLAGVELMMGRVGGARPMPMDVVVEGHPDRGYRRLTLADRSFIQAGLAMRPPLSIRSIAAELSVSASTVSREIRAHQVRHWDRSHYDAEIAHYRALAARPRSRPGKLEHPPLRDAVVSRLNNRYSPQQVAGELTLLFPDDPEMRVSHETIYQALYVQSKGALRHELTVEKALRSGRTTRIPKSKLPRRSSRPWLEGARLADRPAEVEDRAVPGHWEGDLVVGPGNSGIVTLVERTHRFTLLGRLPGQRDSKTVTDVLAGMIRDLPATLTRTITWDQGAEMAEHAAFTIASDCNVYFCDPHSPWQRGTNENTNGLIRDFYPKGTNFNEITDDELTETQRLLNIRPRRTLGYRKPADMINELINGVALTT